MATTNIQIQVGKKAFEFDSYAQWVNKARSWFEQHRLTGDKAICIDAQGRICGSGREFMRARDDNSYPISVYPKII